MRPKKFTVRKKYRIALFLWFVNACALMLGAVGISAYFLIPLVVLLLIIGLYTISLKCSRCGKRVLYNPFTILGTTIWIWTAWIPKKCTQCGNELR
jgi:hypothetical protein